MPKALEAKLQVQLSRKGLQGRSLDRAVAVTMQGQREAQTPAVGHPHKNLGAYLHKPKGKPAKGKRGSLAAHAAKYR